MSRASKGVGRTGEAVHLSRRGEQRDLLHPLEVIDFVSFMHMKSKIAIQMQAPTVVQELRQPQALRTSNKNGGASQYADMTTKSKF